MKKSNSEKKITPREEEVKSWSRDDLESVWHHYFDLVNYLHEHSEDLPPKIYDEISDDLYAHYEP